MSTHTNAKDRSASPHTADHSQSPFQPRPFESAESESAPPTAAPGVGHNFANISILPKTPIPIQAKLTVGAPDDAYEQEADAVAERVMSMPTTPPIQRQAEEEELQMKSAITPLVQRQELPEEELQMKSTSGQSPQTGNDLETRLSQSQGGGSPLSEDVRGFMEPRFGTNFSQVRVHTDNAAIQMNRELGAHAFAHGNDIYFGAGKAPAKDNLTAHELTHVIQQTDSVQSKISERIQRGGPSTPTREFIPLTSSSPSEATLKLYQRHTHSWRIWNWRDAPPRTYFHWGGGLSGTSGDNKLSLIDIRSRDRGATSLIQVEAQKPGNTQIQGTPVHQVPGGPEVMGETQHADITVTQPTLQLLSIAPRRANGSPAQSDHLGRGDRLIARVKVGNVDGQRMEDPGATATSGQGHQLMSVGEVRPVQRFPDGRSYDIELTANAEGSVNLNLELGLGRIPLGAGPNVRVTAEIEHDRQHFINLCNQCDTIISRAYTRADTIMEKLSAAYGDAWDAHVRTLEAQDASNRLAGEIILGAALAFIPGGVGGVVGGFMRDAKAGDFLVDAIKDMAKAGTRGVQGALVGNSRGGAAMQPLGDNPRTLRAGYVERVNSEKERVLDILNDWKTKANASDPSFYLNFNPVELTRQSLSRNGQPLSEIAVPDQAENARLFELGFWRTWLETHGYTVASTPTRAGTVYFAQENLGKKIRDRINALRENGDQWLEQYGGIARQRAEAEAQRRNSEVDRF